MSAHDTGADLCGCDDCVAEDLGAMVGRPPTLPDGWSTKRNPLGSLGADSIVYDASGDWVGTYGYVVNRRADAEPDPYPWMAAGRRYRTEADAVAAVVARRTGGVA